MGNTSPSGFSFDVYPGLDAELQAAYARNTQDAASPEALAASGLAAAVEGALGERARDTGNVPEDVMAWAAEDLDTIGTGFHSWWQYKDHLGQDIPRSVAELINRSPDLGPTLARLHEAKLDLTNSGEVTPEGTNIGDTMHLVAMPWQAMKDNLGNFEAFINKLRPSQGINEGDFINSDLLDAITQSQLFYRIWGNQGVQYSAHGYLDAKISQDGPWGLALVQTSNEAGVKGLVGKSPDEISANFTQSPEIAGHAVGSMGIFEWLALTLQQDPRNLSSRDYTWMLANRLEIERGGAHVPYGDWDAGQVKSRLRDSDDQDEDARPRLAVM